MIMYVGDFCNYSANYFNTISKLDITNYQKNVNVIIHSAFSPLLLDRWLGRLVLGSSSALKSCRMIEYLQLSGCLQEPGRARMLRISNLFAYGKSAVMSDGCLVTIA